MLERIVVGYDATEPADEALALATSLALAFGSELIVAYVFDDLVTRVSQEAAGVVAAHVDDVFARATATLGEGVAYRAAEIPGTSPARELLELADREPADLIVVGSRRLGPLQRISTGSVSQAIVNGSSRPVAVAPRGFTGDRQPPRRVAVGWIPSLEADAALRLGSAVAMAGHGHLTLITTVMIKSTLPVAGAVAFLYESYLADLLRGARRDAEAAVAKLDVDRASIAIAAEVGDAAEVLIERSADLDLIVVGSRGYGPLRRVLLGGVSSHVLRDARCPVMLVPRP